MDISNYTQRELQKECARALAVIQANNNELVSFNKQAHHDSQNWYRAVIYWYIDKYGDLPSKSGPGKGIKLISDV